MKDTKTKWLLIATLISIMVSILFYYYIRNLSHPPDYGYHSVMSILFKENPRSIFIWSYEQLDFICKNHNIARISPVITSPSLYANITGKALFLIDLFLKNQKLSLKIVELLQVSFGLINLYYIYKISGFVFKKEFPRIMSILLVSNLQMFSYMMSHLNYDNLVNLASTLSIYYLLHYMKKRDMKDVFKLLLWICVGCLTKFTFGPLLILILLVFIFNERKRVKEILKDTKVFLFKKKNIVLTSLTTIFIILTAVFYGNNILTYNTVLPSSKQGKEEVAYCKALDPVEEELNVGDQEESSSLEESDNEIEVEEEPEQVGIFKYFIIWCDLMVERLINIASHKSLYKPRIYTVIFEIIFLLSGVLFLAKYRFKNKYINVLLILVWGYIGYLFLYKYMSYLSSGSLDRAVAGRYMFPVIGPFIILFVYSFWNILKKKTIPTIILVILSVIFIYSDKVFLLKNYKTWSAIYRISTEGTTDSIFEGQSSPKQRFSVQEEYSNRELGVYISTYGNTIRKGITFNLYEDDCFTNIESIEMKGIRDNQYKIIKFSNKLEYDKEYCFDIKNEGSDKPITLWYSSEDLEGYSSTILLEEKDGVDYTVGPLNREESSPKQVFYINEGYSNNEIAVFASTYERSITEGFQFNLYDESCLNKIEVVDIDRIWDNDYFFIELKNTLEHEKHYCFDIENIGSDEPITLWYSSINLNGNLFEDEDKDIHYSQVKEVEEERDLLYSPILKYGF